MLNIGYVPDTDIDRVWFEITPFVERVLEYAGGRVTLGSLYSELISGSQALWVVSRPEDHKIVGFCTSRIVQYPATRLLSVDMLSGDDGVFDEWIDPMLAALTKCAKLNGCVGMEAGGRWGWARKLKSKGWTKAISIVENRF